MTKYNKTVKKGGAIINNSNETTTINNDNNMDDSNNYNYFENILKKQSDIFVMLQPMNIVLFITFFSPIILAIVMVSLTFIFQNVKGLVYLGFLLAISIFRRYVYKLSGMKSIEFDNTACTAIQYSKYGNSTFSTFIFAFTLLYLFIPMFQLGVVNWAIFSGLLFYIIFDAGVKFYKQCLDKNDIFMVIGDFLFGSVLGSIISTSMYYSGSGKYMFFSEIGSDKDVCYMPKKQSFKCSVYKNGELIA